jgi:hypothetical protein
LPTGYVTLEFGEHALFPGPIVVHVPVPGTPDVPTAVFRLSM